MDRVGEQQGGVALWGMIGEQQKRKGSRSRIGTGSVNNKREGGHTFGQGQYTSKRERGHADRVGEQQKRKCHKLFHGRRTTKEKGVTHLHRVSEQTKKKGGQPLEQGRQIPVDERFHVSQSKLEGLIVG